MHCKQAARFLVLCVVLVSSTRHETGAADGQIDFAKHLGAAILEKDQPAREVGEFCERRITPMPELSTAADWDKFATQTRQKVLDTVVFRGEAAKWRTAKTQVEFFDTIEGGPEYHIRKLRYEALPGLWIPALLYEPKKLDGQIPVVLNVNGHDGKGKAADYKQIRCINQAKRGMLALNVEWLGMGQLRGENYVHYRMNQLDLCGTSGLAPFYLAMSRGLDVLLSHKHADPQRVAVAGLSGGGWQTIIISSLDERVTLSNPVAGYSSFRTRARHGSDLGDSEQTPVDLGMTADYAVLTAMRAPRPTLLTFNAKDNCCFAAAHALPPLLEAARPVYQLYGKADYLRSHVNEVPGDHNFGLDNRQALYRMFGEFFCADDTKFNPEEIPCESELKSAEDLHVPLPENNASFHSLAVELSQSLPAGRHARMPEDGSTLDAWRKTGREQLNRIIRSREYSVTAKKAGDAVVENDVTIVKWRLNCGDDWTLPAIEFAPQQTDKLTILIGDAGRAALGNSVRESLNAGRRVLAVDPFYFGESKITSRDFLFALLVSTVGDRPLGLQASQLRAVINWAKAEFNPTQIELRAYGHRTSLIALTAAADARHLSRVTLYGSLTSLKQVIERNTGINQEPELFCFGLLEAFDIAILRELAHPAEVVTQP